MATIFQLAAEPHNVLSAAQESGSLLDSAADMVSKGLPASFIAAGNELGNAISTIGSWVSGDEQTALVENRAAIAAVDSDLAKYYDDHQLGIDTAGFMISSMVPGTLGMKGVRVGQAMLRTTLTEGTMGGTAATALGLRVPAQQSLVARAIQSIGNEGRVFKYTDADVVRALGAGAYQNAIEGIAFTSVVNATMYNSPILSDKSVSDLVWEAVTWGGIGGGVIGGLVSGIGAASSIRRGLNAIDAEMDSMRVVSRLEGGAYTESDKMLHKVQQLHSLPVIDPESPLARRAGATAAQTKRTLETEIRGHISALTDGDEELANLVYRDVTEGHFTDIVAKYSEAASITRVPVSTEAERKMREAARTVKGKLSLELTAEEVEAQLQYNVSYVNILTKEVSTERPPLLTLGDRGTPVILPDGRGVSVGKITYKHENNPYRPYNILGQSHQNVESRYLWAESLAPWVDDGAAVVHEYDIPLLQKAQRDGLTSLKVIPEGGALADAVILNSADEIARFTRAAQRTIGDKLLRKEAIAQDADGLVDKLKYYLGINFNAVEDSAGNYMGLFKRLHGKTARGSEVSGDAIVLNLTAGTGALRPLSDMIRTLKHEEGHALFQALLDARGVSRDNLTSVWPALREEVRALSKLARPAAWKQAAERKEYAEYLNNWHELMADGFQYLSRHPDRIKKYPEFDKFAGHLVRPLPQELIDAALVRATKPSAEEVAKIINTDVNVVRGVVDDPSLYNARQIAVETATKQNLPDPRVSPLYAKVITKRSRMLGADGNLLEGMAIVEQKMELYRARCAATADAGLGEVLPDARGTAGLPLGDVAGASMLGSENGNYGSLSSFYAHVGQRTHALIKAAKATTDEIFNSQLVKLAQDQKSAIEWSVLNERMRGLPNRYFLSEDGTALQYGSKLAAEDFTSEAAYAKALAQREQELAELAAQGIPEEIPIQSELVQELVASHILRNTKRREVLQKVHTDNGLPDRFQSGVFYPIPRDPRNTPHYAFVVDNSVGSTGHSKMIYAKDAETLEQMRNSIMSDPTLVDRGIQVLTKKDAEDYFKSVGQYEFERSLSENYINTALARKGTSESFIPLTDPSLIVKEFADWHHARDAALVRTLVEHKYAPEFSGFRARAEAATGAAKSRFGYVSPLAYAEKAVNTPALNLMKTALDIGKMDEYPLWSAINKFADDGFSSLANRISQLTTKLKAPDELVSVQRALEQAGYTGPQLTETLYRASNQTVPKHVLSDVVNKANSLVATFALRLDWMNSLNNAVGSSVLLGAELKSVLRAIEQGNAEAVGELAALAKVKVPGTGDLVLSPSKLIANRIAKFHSDKEGREWFRTNGFSSTISEQYDQTLGHISEALARGDASKLQGAIDGLKQLGVIGERITGNKLAEEFNRYIAAGVMKDITDIAVKHGLMRRDRALSYINTFVNRTQGNYLASQRPTVFQGPIGQAIGLFQTYQFNMLQQIFRHIGDGNVRNVATMMGLQASVYGLNGLPAFNAINTYLIGQAGGNREHKTLYDAVLSGAGKEAGEWLLYGGLSNGLSLVHPDLKINMYSRGDINPRHVTLIPTDPTKVPIYQATERLLANAKESYSKVAMGADVWSTFLRGLEQNGISRPLAGLAQVLEAAGREDKKLISMNRNGNMQAAHDLWSLSSLMRIAGAKPLDEAIVNDMVFRNNSYRAADAEKRKVLSEGIKQSIIGGKEPDEAQLRQFAEEYARTGGKQKEFAAWYAGLYRNATVSQAEQLRQHASGAEIQGLQIIMNGGE